MSDILLRRRSIIFILLLFSATYYVLGQDAEQCYQKAMEYHIKNEFSNAVIWAKKAADQDHAIALFYLVDRYEFGYGTQQNMKEAIKVLTRSAELGYYPAQFDLGRRYESGTGGLVQNSAEAFKWYKAAAIQDHKERNFMYHMTDAETSLANLYENGIGVPSDLIIARYWYKKALYNDNYLKTAEARVNDIDKILSSPTIDLNSEQFSTIIIDYTTNPTEWKYNGTEPCILYFNAKWYGPPSKIRPIMDIVGEKYKNKLTIYHIDVHEEKELASFCNVHGVPCLIFIPLSDTPTILTGFQTVEYLSKVIDDILLKY